MTQLYLFDYLDDLIYWSYNWPVDDVWPIVLKIWSDLDYLPKQLATISEWNEFPEQSVILQHSSIKNWISRRNFNPNENLLSNEVISSGLGGKPRRVSVTKIKNNNILLIKLLFRYFRYK